MVTRKKTDTIQLSKIRMSEDLRRRLAREAEKNGATLNGEIVDRLESSFTIENIDLLLDRKIDLTIKIAVTKALQNFARVVDQMVPKESRTVDFYKALVDSTVEEDEK